MPQATIEKTKKKKKTIVKKDSLKSKQLDVEKAEQRQLDAIEGLIDPRRRKFASGYLDPDSKTFGNARQSMLLSGFSADYADQITSLRPKWFMEIIGINKILEQAVANLQEDISLSLYHERKSVSGKGTEKVFDKDKAKHRREMTQVALRALHNKFKPQSPNSDDEEGSSNVFKGAVFKNFVINYNAPKPEEGPKKREEIEVEATDVPSDDLDISEFLN